MGRLREPSGQRLHRAVAAVAEVRGGVSRSWATGSRPTGLYASWMPFYIRQHPHSFLDGRTLAEVSEERAPLESELDNADKPCDLARKGTSQRGARPRDPAAVWRRPRHYRATHGIRRKRGADLPGLWTHAQRGLDSDRWPSRRRQALWKPRGRARPLLLALPAPRLPQFRSPSLSWASTINIQSGYEPGLVRRSSPVGDGHEGITAHPMRKYAEYTLVKVLYLSDNGTTSRNGSLA